MSSTSPQAEAAAEQSVWQAKLSQQLSTIARPELAARVAQLSGMLGSVDSSGRMGADQQIRTQALGTLNQSFDQAKVGSGEAINYGALRSGESRLSPGAVSSALGGAASGLERDRQSALRNLEFASAQSSMGDYNKVLQLLGQGTNTSLGLAQGFSGAQNAAIGGLSGQTQAGGIIGGAATGAGLGTSISPGYGTAIGAVVGGIYGGLTSP